MNLDKIINEMISDIIPDRTMNEKLLNNNIEAFRKDFWDWNPFPENWEISLCRRFIPSGREFYYFTAEHNKEFCIVITDGSWIYTKMKYNKIEYSKGCFIDQRDEVKESIIKLLRKKNDSRTRTCII